MKAKHCVFVTALTALLCVGPSASGDVPFGPYHLMDDKFGPPLTLTMAGPKTPEEALRFLKAAREKKTKVLIHLTGGRERHQNADKSFSVEKFAALLERFQGVDFSQAGARPENIRRALACLEILRQQTDVDPRRIAAYGHSMGAFVTIALTAVASDKIAAAAITAGGVMTAQYRAASAPTTNVAEEVRVPFLILQGALDNTVPPESSELFKQVLDKSKVPNERHLFEGVSHNLPGERADEVNHLIREWFTKHGVLAEAPSANVPREMPANQN